jgi:hypothetical protein
MVGDVCETGSLGVTFKLLVRRSIEDEVAERPIAVEEPAEALVDA